MVNTDQPREVPARMEPFAQRFTEIMPAMLRRRPAYRVLPWEQSWRGRQPLPSGCELRAVRRLYETHQTCAASRRQPSGEQRALRTCVRKTERRRSANLLQMTRGPRYKLRLCGQGYGGRSPARFRRIGPSFQPPPALVARLWARIALLTNGKQILGNHLRVTVQQRCSESQSRRDKSRRHANHFDCAASRVAYLRIPRDRQCSRPLQHF